MRLQELMVRLQIPQGEGKEPVTVEATNAILTRDFATRGSGIPLVAYICSSLRCGTYVIRPER